MTDSTTGDLERKIVLAVREATGSGWPPDKPPTEGELNFTRAALKTHAEWLEDQGLVVVPKSAVWSSTLTYRGGDPQAPVNLPWRIAP